MWEPILLPCKSKKNKTKQNKKAYIKHETGEAYASPWSAVSYRSHSITYNLTRNSEVGRCRNEKVN